LMSSTSSWPCSNFCAFDLKIRKCSSIVLRKYRSVCVGCRKILRTEILILAGFLTGLLLEGDNKWKISPWKLVRFLVCKDFLWIHQLIVYNCQVVPLLCR
jgi:hypothetical protein